MLYSKIFCWPNYKDGDELAEEFFAKAAAQFHVFPFEDEDCSLSLVHANGDKMCHIFVGLKTTHDDSVATTRAVEAFLRNSGCPKEQDTESFNSWSLVLHEIAPRFREAGGKILRRLDRPAAKSPHVVVGPALSTEASSNAVKPWWKFW